MKNCKKQNLVNDQIVAADGDEVEILVIHNDDDDVYIDDTISIIIIWMTPA